MSSQMEARIIVEVRERMLSSLIWVSKRMVVRGTCLEVITRDCLGHAMFEVISNIAI